MLGARWPIKRSPVMWGGVQLQQRPKPWGLWLKHMYAPVLIPVLPMQWHDVAPWQTLNPASDGPLPCRLLWT